MIFRELNSGDNLLSLEPGFYCVSCQNRFNADMVKEFNRICRYCRCIDLFTGLLMPYFLHNISNILAGVTGNIELAEMFMPDIRKVQEKLFAAGSAAGLLVEFIRTLTGTLGTSGTDVLDTSCLRRVNLFLNTACGRSVSTSGTETMNLDSPLYCSDISQAFAALIGMATWCVLCVAGRGEIKGTAEGRIISFEWEKPKGAGITHMPGAEQAPAAAALAGEAASASGSALIIQRWTDNSGKVSLAVGR
ncbi:hypothetical protein CSA37_06415 [Candidatus Fermentibacteria bacterium]|nr:MAG: hypothetical protein CSA37_06415 [Candidatus Fermentibacteria bacterium]